MTEHRYPTNFTTAHDFDLSIHFDFYNQGKDEFPNADQITEKMETLLSELGAKTDQPLLTTQHPTTPSYVVQLMNITLADALQLAETIREKLIDLGGEEDIWQSEVFAKIHIDA